MTELKDGIKKIILATRVLNELKFRTDSEDNRVLTLMDLRALIEMIDATVTPTQEGKE